MPVDERASVIEGLREQIRRIERRPCSGGAVFVPSGWPRVDALLPGGGFPRGAISELTGGRASGKTAVALSTLARATGEHGIAAFVDGRGELYPPAAVAFGLQLERLLIIRPRDADETVAARSALWATEALLASGAFDAVAIDVAVERMRGATPAAIAAVLRRIRAAAEKGTCVALWLGGAGGVRVPCAVRIELTPGARGSRVRRAFARGAGDLAQELSALPAGGYGADRAA